MRPDTSRSLTAVVRQPHATAAAAPPPAGNAASGNAGRHQQAPGAADPHPADSGLRPLLSLQHISKRFGALQVLDDISFDVMPGETLGLIGPNGAAKTSLLNIVNGFSRADTGRLLLDGRDILPLAPGKRARLGMARCFQSSRIFPEHSLIDNLAFAIRIARGGAYRLFDRGASLARSREQAAAMLSQTLFRQQLHVPAGALSYGSQRLVDLLIALAGEPTLLLLDEPTAGLSRAESAEAMQLLHRFCAHSTRLLISHDLDLVFAHCQRIAVLNAGRLVAIDTTEAIRRHEGAQRAYLGVEQEVQTGISADVAQTRSTTADSFTTASLRQTQGQNVQGPDLQYPRGMESEHR